MKPAPAVEQTPEDAPPQEPVGTYDATLNLLRRQLQQILAFASLIVLTGFSRWPTPTS